MSAKVLPFPGPPARETAPDGPLTDGPNTNAQIRLVQRGVSLTFASEDEFWAVCRRTDPELARLNAEADADRITAARILAEAGAEIARAEAITDRERLRGLRRAQVRFLLKLAAQAGALAALAVFAMGAF